MSSTIFFFVFIPLLACILLAINLLFAPHNPYQEKNSAFECGFTSFLGQNRTQFSISFFIFALLFLLFDLEILLVYPYLVSAYTNETYGLAIILIFLLALTLGFAFELGKKALSIDSRQTIKVSHIPKPHTNMILFLQSGMFSFRGSYYFKLISEKLNVSTVLTRLFVVLPGIAFIKNVLYNGNLAFSAFLFMGIFDFFCLSTIGVILSAYLNSIGVNFNLHQLLFGPIRWCMPSNEDYECEHYMDYKNICIGPRPNGPGLTGILEKNAIVKYYHIDRLNENINSKLPPELKLMVLENVYRDTFSLLYDLAKASQKLEIFGISSRDWKPGILPFDHDLEMSKLRHFISLKQDELYKLRYYYTNNRSMPEVKGLDVGLYYHLVCINEAWRYEQQSIKGKVWLYPGERRRIEFHNMSSIINKARQNVTALEDAKYMEEHAEVVRKNYLQSVVLKQLLAQTKRAE